MEEVVRRVLDAAREGDAETLRLALHPYLHWTEGGVTVRGRRNVLERLAGRRTLSPPESYEVRDGQVYRWVAAESFGD
jgi:hypothetical protein